MRKVTFSLVLLGTCAWLFTMATSAQNPQIPSPDYPFPGFPREFSPVNTWRPAKAKLPVEPPTKFVKATRAIPHRYIVVLKEDVVAKNASRESRRARITAIANDHASAHLGRVDFIYDTVLKGYSIELPTEAAAIAISNNPKVRWVEEDVQLEWAQEQGGLEPEGLQSNPPWGLDAIDGTLPQLTPSTNGRSNGQYLYNATGAGVVAYVLDSGIYPFHQDFSTGFYPRASQAADCFTYVNCQSGTLTPYWNYEACAYPMPNGLNNDCHGHGTHVAGTIGGNSYGVAKQVTIKSVKVGSAYGPFLSSVIAGVQWVTNDHLAYPEVPAVANISLGFPITPSLDQAVSNSIAYGVTYVIAAGNNNGDAQNISPARVAEALTVGAVNWTASRSSFSNWGSRVDLFAPGEGIVSALSGNQLCFWDGTNDEECILSGTSQAAPHVAGVVAMYLQGRTGTSLCYLYPVQGSAPPAGGDPSVCPDRVTRFINANARLSVLSNINGTVYDQNGNPVSIPSANRFVWTLPLPSSPNPIDNQRFFVWQHYADFVPLHYITHLPQPEPDEGGLDFWTRQITDHCGTGPNENNGCTQVWRILNSRAFFVSVHESWFNSSYGLNVSNSQFVQEVYRAYLRREADADGLNFWVNELTNNYGNPANEGGVFHIIDAFLSSWDYRRRFGPA